MKRSWNMRLLVGLTVRFLVLALGFRGAHAAEYMLIGVSGGLQDGFPDHSKMDYREGGGRVVPAVFLGQALVRGTKAFLDVMQKNWRQYNPEPGIPLIHAVNVVSGCWEHANQYWIYAVDSRQVLSILNNAPRFLSLTPDTALVDLASNETDDSIRILAHYEIDFTHGKPDRDTVAIPIVVATWYHQSFVPSPVLRVHDDDDGTQVTNYHESLAQWANVDDSDRTAAFACRRQEKEECPSGSDIVAAQRRYWEGIRSAVRKAERKPPLTTTEWQAHGPPYSCQRQAPLGVSPDQVRLNYSFSEIELFNIYGRRGYAMDFRKGILNPPYQTN